MVTSSTIPHSTLGKRWNALSYHKVREAVAGGWLRFEHIPETENPADILTKGLPWFKLRVFVEPLLLWKGDTADVPVPQHGPEGSNTNPGQAVTERDDGSRVTTEDGWTLVRGTRAGGVTNQNSTGGDARASVVSHNMYEVLGVRFGHETPPSDDGS